MTIPIPGSIGDVGPFGDIAGGHAGPAESESSVGSVQPIFSSPFAVGPGANSSSETDAESNGDAGSGGLNLSPVMIALGALGLVLLVLVVRR